MNKALWTFGSSFSADCLKENTRHLHFTNEICKYYREFVDTDYRQRYFHLFFAILEIDVTGKTSNG